MSACAFVLAGVLAGCSGSSAGSAASGQPSSAANTPSLTTSPTAAPSTPSSTPAAAVDPNALPGMPPLLDPHDAYAADRPGMLSPVVKDMPQRVYVPNSESNTVSVIDPVTYRVLSTTPVGRQPQHVVPSWDLKTLWVNNDLGNSLTPIDPATGAFGTPVPVHDPYNLYFTPDGRSAIVMASADHAIVFLDPHTMAVQKSLPVPCSGVNHADFSLDGRYFVVSCEFSATLLRVDTLAQSVLAVLKLPGGGMPQDVKIAPDGHVFYVADMRRNGVWLIDGPSLSVRGFVPTGRGAHGLYVSRDSRTLYVSDRDEGAISLLDVRTDAVTGKWRIPGGGSPDMGGLSADGTALWLTGRYNSVVYVMSTADGSLLAKIPVGAGPHGLSFYPQPGRYSLGHTGVFR